MGSEHAKDFSKFRVSIIEQIPEDSFDRLGTLHILEMFWFFMVNTLIPFGLNEAFRNHVFFKLSV